MLRTRRIEARVTRERAGRGVLHAAPRTPIVCTLRAAEYGTRADAFREVFAHLIETTAFPGGFRWVFRAAPSLEARLFDLAEHEHACCRFFEFRVFMQDDTIVWETHAGDDAAFVLSELMGLPATLAAASDVGSLARACAVAGVSFVPDREG